MRLVHVLKAARRGLRPGEARHPPARPGRLVEEHDRAPPEAGRRALLAHARRRALHLRLGEPRRAPASPARDVDRFPSPMNEEPLRLIPPEWRAKAIEELGLSNDQFKVRVEGDLDPASRFIFKALMHKYDGDWSKVVAKHIRVRRLVLEREGPRRHRHLPAEGREEPGLDRAHRRHQLPQDRRVRLGLRPARLQLRRRVQHREPRHRRVHRDAQARRRVPLRSARRVAGAQDQAEEVRADGHRRGHHRPHQRGRVQEAPEQRVHGSPARPHDQDRHPLHHEAHRGDPHLREGLQRREDQGQAHRAAHARGRRDVGRAHAPRGPEEAQPVAPPEDEALRRQGPARVHAGHREGAPQGGEARGHGRHQPALRAGQDLERARQRRRARGRSTRSWS